MSYGSHVRTQRSTDALAADHLPACPDCGDLAHRTATVCDGCGTHLYPKTTTAPAREPLTEGGVQGRKETIMAPLIGCTSCGGNRLCTVCQLDELDNGSVEHRMMQAALDATEQALARKPAALYGVRS